MQIIKQKPHPSLITLPSYDPTFKEEEIPVLHTVEFVPSPWPVATPQFSVTLCICLMNESSPIWASYLFSSPHPFSSAEEVFLKSNQVNPGSECLYGQILNPLVCHKICCCSVAKLCRTLCDPINCNTPEFSLLHCLLEFAQIHVHWVGDAIQPPHPLLPCSPPASIFLSIRVFSNESALFWISWPKYWSFSFGISPSREYSGLISFRTTAQGTLKSPLQNHSSKASIPQHSAFFMVQLSHLYMTTGKTIAYATLLLTRPPSVLPPQSWACGAALPSHVQP